MALFLILLDTHCQQEFQIIYKSIKKDYSKFVLSFALILNRKLYNLQPTNINFVQ